MHIRTSSGNVHKNALYIVIKFTSGIVRVDAEAVLISVVHFAETSVQSTRSFHQGVRSFPSFEQYLEGWIKRNLLADLETVFVGAKERWISTGRSENGRGDFLLATLLFSVFDHLGTFIARPGDKLVNHENIARVAKHLDSTKDVYAIVSNLGRNALVHGAWPQTAVPRDGCTWGFGININGDIDERQHNLLYVKLYPIGWPGGQLREVPVLKLRLNVHVMRKELIEWLHHDLRVSRKAFDRARNLAMLQGIPEPGKPRERTDAKYTWPAPGERWNDPLCDIQKMGRQIQRLRREAEDLGAFQHFGQTFRRRAQRHKTFNEKRAP